MPDWGTTEQTNNTVDDVKMEEETSNQVFLQFGIVLVV